MVKAVETTNKQVEDKSPQAENFLNESDFQYSEVPQIKFWWFWNTIWILRGVSFVIIMFGLWLYATAEDPVKKWFHLLYFGSLLYAVVSTLILKRVNFIDEYWWKD